jgi:hypothetical protein
MHRALRTVDALPEAQAGALLSTSAVDAALDASEREG